MGFPFTYERNITTVHCIENNTFYRLRNIDTVQKRYVEKYLNDVTANYKILNATNRWYCEVYIYCVWIYNTLVSFFKKPSE